MKKKVLLATNITLVTVLTASTAVACGSTDSTNEDKKSKDVKKQVALKVKEKEAITAVNESDINKVIKAKKAFDITTDSQSYKDDNFAKEIQIVKNDIHITVKLTPEAVDTTKGEITWTATLASPNGESGTLKGSLAGFSTKAKRDADEALAKLTPALINDSIKATKAFTDADRVSAYTPFPQTVIVAIDGHDITVTLTKGAVSNDAGTIAWTASANVLNAGSTAVSKTGTLTGFSTKAKRETQKEDDILANLTAQEIETEIKKATTLNSNTDPKDAQLDLTVKFVKDSINVTAVIKKGTIDRLTGKADWSSIISTPNASAKRINLKGTIDNLLAKPLLEVERVINLNPTTTLTSQIGNKEIKQTGLADFGLTEKSLGINSLSSKISDIKITQDNYDFKNNKFKATITFNFQPDLKNSKKIKATYKLEIDGFKGPKITPADPTKISSTDFIGLQLPDDFTIPATVKTIEAGAFKGMKLNSSFQIPDTVTTIGENVFNNTEIPKGFKMPKAWSVIVGTSAFKYAKLPEGFVVPSTVKTINAGAFEETKMHPSFTVPDTIEHIESAAFKHDDSSLPKSFRLPTNPKFTTITSNQFQNTYLNDGFTIPKNVTSIGRQAFWSARMPIGFKVPASVSYIEFTAFGHSKLVAGAHVEDLNGKVIDWTKLSLSDKAWYARAGFVVVADKPTTTSPSSSAPASPLPTKSQINYLTEEVFSNTLDSKKIYTDAK